MNNFNNKLLDKAISDKYKNNKEFMIDINNLGVSVKEDAIKKWRQGNSTPKTIDIAKICKLLNIDVYDLLYVENKNKAANSKDYTLLPSYNVRAGAGGEGYLPDALESTKIPVSNKFLNGCNPEFLHIIQVAGDSMEPTIRPNDWLIIDMVSNGTYDRSFEKVDGIYLISKDGSIQIKRLAFRGTKGIDIISDNPMYPIENTLERGIELDILGKLFKHVQDLGALAIKELE